MTVCCLKTCKSTSTKHKKRDKVTYHSFPIDPVIFHGWIKIVRRNRRQDSWKPSKASKICSKHFGKKDKYLTKNGFQKIRPGAVPRKLLFSDSRSSSESDSEDNENSEKSQDELCNKNNSTEGNFESCPDKSTEQPLEVTTVSNDDDVKIGVVGSHKVGDVVTKQTSHDDPNIDCSDSELAYLLDTSKEAKFRQELKRKAALIDKQGRTIKTLRQKTLRLTKRNISLKKMLVALKKRFVNK